MDKPKSPNIDILKRRAFVICLAVYRLTGIFPKNESISNQLREISGQIAALLAAGKINDTILKIEEIRVFLAIARNQNWAGSLNFDLLLNAYGLLVEALLVGRNEAKRKEESAPKKTEIDSPPPIKKKKNGGAAVIPGDNFRRQKVILDFCAKNSEVTVPQLAEILDNVSERTIRKDLAELILKKVVTKNGSRKGAKYILKK